MYFRLLQLLLGCTLITDVNKWTKELNSIQFKWVSVVRLPILVLAQFVPLSKMTLMTFSPKKLSSLEIRIFLCAISSTFVVLPTSMSCLWELNQFVQCYSHFSPNLKVVMIIDAICKYGGCTRKCRGCRNSLDVCNDIGNGNKQKTKILGKASEYSLIVYFVIFYVHLIIY